MRNALVLTGGGATAGYEVGALEPLQSVSFDVIAGVSSGALNGVMVAQNKQAAMRDIWHTVAEDQVFKKYSTIGVALRLLTGKRSLYDLSPLMKLIKQHVRAEDLVKKFYAGTVDMHTGIYHSVRFGPPNGVRDHSSEFLQHTVYASAIMPIIWSPASLAAGDSPLGTFADGGLRNIAPLADVIADLPDKIYIIMCQPPALNLAPVDTFLHIIKRTVEIFTAEIVENDLDKLLTINQLVLQATDQGAKLVNPKNGKSYKYFETVIIRPQQSLGDATDFSRQHIEQCYAQGVEDAKAILRSQEKSFA